MNIKHKYIQKYGQEYCCKCETRFYDLLSVARKISTYDDGMEKFGDFVNRINPCLSDEEAIIKKALE